MRVDPEFKALIPPLSGDERQQLEANILADGCRDALAVWNDTLLDGHNRHEICTAHNIPFETRLVNLANRDAAVGWTINNQLGRRNLTPEQSSLLRGRLYNRMKKQGERTDLTSPQNEEKSTTAERLAKQRKPPFCKVWEVRNGILE